MGSPLDRGQILNHLRQKERGAKDVYTGRLRDLDMGACGYSRLMAPKV